MQLVKLSAVLIFAAFLGVSRVAADDSTTGYSAPGIETDDSDESCEIAVDGTYRCPVDSTDDEAGPTQLFLNAGPAKAPADAPEPALKIVAKVLNDRFPGVDNCPFGQTNPDNLPAPTPKRERKVKIPGEKTTPDDETCGCWFYANRVWKKAPSGMFESPCTKPTKPKTKKTTVCRKGGVVAGKKKSCYDGNEQKSEPENGAQCLKDVDIDGLQSTAFDSACADAFKETGRCEKVKRTIQVESAKTCAVCQRLVPVRANTWRWGRTCIDGETEPTKTEVEISCETAEIDEIVEAGTRGIDGYQVRSTCVTDGKNDDGGPNCSRSCEVFLIPASRDCQLMYPLDTMCHIGAPEEPPPVAELPDPVPYQPLPKEEAAEAPSPPPAPAQKPDVPKRDGDDSTSPTDAQSSDVLSSGPSV